MFPSMSNPKDLPLGTVFLASIGPLEFRCRFPVSPVPMGKSPAVEGADGNFSPKPFRRRTPRPLDAFPPT